MNLKTAWVLARKDLKLFFRDRTAVLLAFALPILLGSIMGGALGSAMNGGGGGDDQPCNGADLAAPFGVRDLADIQAYIIAFNAGCAQ